MNENLNSLLKNFFLFSGLKSSLKEIHEIVEGVLVHRINNAQVTDYEIDHTASLGDWSVLLSCLVNLLTGHLCQLDTLVYCLWSHFGCIKGIDQLLVLENSALGVADLTQDLVL